MISLRISLLIVLFTLFNKCTSTEAAIQYPDKSKRELGINKIAVLTFEIEDAKWDGEFTDSVSLQLAKNLSIAVIEREQLSKVVNEQAFSKTGVIDTQTAVRIGKILGVDALVFGRGSALRKFDTKGNPIPNLLDTVSLKIVHIESGQVVANARKTPGSDWTPLNLTKFLLSLSLIWDRQDILIESSQYDFVAARLIEAIKSELK